jgi:CRP-like cAMP-binding protein
MGDADLLARCELFAGLGPDLLARVASSSHTEVAVRNQVLFREGDPADDLYVVRNGRVAVVKRADAGRESVVALIGAGEVFGELGLFDGGGRSADARAIEPTDLVVLPYPALREALGASPAALWALLALLTERLRATDESLADSMFLDVPGRTAKRLLELAGDGDRFGAAVTQDELASMVGASRERVNKAIATFVRLGWLEQSGRRYRILDRDRLAGCAR